MELRSVRSFVRPSVGIMKLARYVRPAAVGGHAIMPRVTVTTDAFNSITNTFNDFVTKNVRWPSFTVRTPCIMGLDARKMRWDDRKRNYWNFSLS